MAPTRIADVIVPSVFNAYVSKRTMELSVFQASGIIANDPQLNALASGGGKLINMPYWNDLTGDDEVLSDTTALTPQNITTNQDAAPLYMRGKAWAANDLAAALSGSDPMREIGDKVAAFWARQRQKLVIQMLKGVFAASSMSGSIFDVSGGTGAASNINATSFIGAGQLLGDAKGGLTAIAMHSAVEAYLAAQDLIEFRPTSEGSTRVPTYMRHRVVVDDALVDSSGVYTSYLFGQGAIGYGQASAPVPTETDRDSLAGDDILINRDHFVLHPRGVKWTNSSVVGSSPTNAEAATAANWSRVYDKKDIRIVAFKHKINQS